MSTQDPNALDNPERLQALGLTGLMDSLPEDSFDRITRIAAKIMGVPVSLLSLVDDQRQFFKSAQGLGADIRGTPLSHSFCQYVVQASEPLVVEDAHRHDLVKNNGAVRDLGVRAYLGVPVFAPTGQPLGSLCAIDIKPRIWEDGDVEIMQDLAHVVMAEIKLRSEIEHREENENRLQLLSREMAHRVKNVFSLTSGLIAISAQDDSSKAFAQKISYRLQALANAQEYVHVNRMEEKAGNTLSGLLEALTGAYPADKFAIDASDVIVGENAATAFALVIHELTTNAVKYGALSVPDGRVTISIQNAGEILHLGWKESGGPTLFGEPTAQGFGRSMIGRSMKIYLGGGAEYVWDADGLQVKLQANTSRVSV